jgi:hypothetical protein
MKLRIFLSLTMLASTFQVWAQQEQLSQLTTDEERKAVEAIALYPENQRTAILEAAMHPEVLVRMQNLQNKSETEFQEILFPLTRADQENFYDLARSPQLIEDMGSGNTKKSRTEMSEILSKYPKDMHESANEVNDKQFKTLLTVRDLFKKSNDKFEDLLLGYPPKTQQAYRTLLEVPEVLEILTDNMTTTVLLGDIYRRYPAQLNKELDALQVSVSAQKAREQEEWQKSLKENPEALAEYEQSAQQFAQEQGYDERVYQNQTGDSYTNVYVNYVWQPYPYWFGRPWWHAHRYWYPYPYWYHWGFYYGPGGGMVFMGLPSYGFMNWHFYNYANFYYYPHFTNVIITHCHRSNTGSSMNSVVRDWENDVSRETPRDFLREDNNRVDRLREFGKFEMDYQETVQRETANAPDKLDYLSANQARYPQMKPLLEEKPQRAPEQSPSRKPAAADSPTRANPAPTRPADSGTTKPAPRPIEQQQDTRERPIDRATDHHQNTWQRPGTTPPAHRTPQQPPVNRQPTAPPVNRQPSSPPVNRQPSSPPAQRQPSAAPQRSSPPSSPQRSPGGSSPQRGGSGGRR